MGEGVKGKGRLRGRSVGLLFLTKFRLTPRCMAFLALDRDAFLVLSSLLVCVLMIFKETKCTMEQKAKKKSRRVGDLS